MKLHLPSRLRSALLACLALLSPFAPSVSGVALTAGVAAFSLAPAYSAVYTISGSNSETLVTANEDDTIIMDLSGYLYANATSKVHDVEASLEIRKMLITNGSSNYTYGDFQ